ncbi:MAG: MFS transporter [Candidatus Helarchaeota archaeon]
MFIIHNNKELIPEKLSFSRIFGYALGAIPTTLYAGIFTLCYIELFYDDLGLAWELFIIGQIIYMIINALNDPLLGQLSDRTNREKWGSRRKIYIKYGAPIWALTFLIIWWPWSYTNQMIIFIHYIISICSFDTMLTLVVLCWMALLPESTSDIDTRNRMNFWAGILGFFAALPVILIYTLKNTNYFAFQIANIVVAIISTICLLIVAKLGIERPEYQRDEVFPLFKSIKETVKRKSFLIFIGFNFCMVFNTAIGISYVFTYLYIFGLTDLSNLLYLIGGFFLIYAGIGYTANIICIKLRKKYGMRNIILKFGSIKVIISLITFLLLLDPILMPFIWIGFALLTFFGGYGVFTYPLMTLSMDEDEVINKTRREGMFLGINALFTKPADSLGPIVATIILESFGYVTGEGFPPQPASALLGIKILFLIVPAIVTGISLIFIYFYPLHGEKLKKMEEQLEKIHKQKRERLFKENNKTNQ